MRTQQCWLQHALMHAVLCAMARYNDRVARNEEQAVCPCAHSSTNHSTH